MESSPIHDDEIVYVPVPRRHLPTVYQTLAAVMVETPKPEGTSMLTQLNPKGTKPTLIDRIIEVARKLDAEQKSISLTTLQAAYLDEYPHAEAGRSPDSFNATVNYHCINMRSRFPIPNDKRKTAYWLTRPAFHRVARGQYKLLTNDEIAKFQRCVESGDPLIYANAYDIADLGKCEDTQEK